MAFNRKSPMVGGLSSEARCAMQITSAKQLEVYKKGYEFAMQIFEASRKFSSKEKPALTNRSILTSARQPPPLAALAELGYVIFMKFRLWSSN
jgi:hypothetical protein